MCRYDLIAVVHRFEIGDPRALGMCATARKLIAEGASPFDRLEGYRGETLCLSGVLWRLAGQTVRENDRQSPTFVKWKPYDRADV
jgi:hypothetical protein